MFGKDNSWLFFYDNLLNDISWKRMFVPPISPSKAYDCYCYKDLHWLNEINNEKNNNI
jgi:hypothetical protein